MSFLGEKKAESVTIIYRNVTANEANCIIIVTVNATRKSRDEYIHILFSYALKYNQ